MNKQDMVMISDESSIEQKVSIYQPIFYLTLISMVKNAHTSAQHGSVLTRFIFFATRNANVCNISTLATCLFSYIIVTLYEHNGYQLKYFKNKYFQSFLTFYFAKNRLNFPNIRIYKIR